MIAGAAPEPMPAGHLAFLFTDIEGSTQLCEAWPDTMPSVIARHPELVDQAAAGDGLVVKDQRDGVFAVFPDPSMPYRLPSPYNCCSAPNRGRCPGRSALGWVCTSARLTPQR